MKKLTDEQKKFVIKVVCPGCMWELPEVRYCDRQMYVHSVPGTEFSMDCKANSLREAFYREDLKDAR